MVRRMEIQICVAKRRGYVLRNASLCERHSVFDVGRSMYHHPIQTNHSDATASLVFLTFLYSLICFGRLHAHHQELTTALRASGFTVGAW
jgi:hypothetical protein